VSRRVTEGREREETEEERGKKEVRRPLKDERQTIVNIDQE
jgi:hypothetical protein